MGRQDARQIVASKLVLDQIPSICNCCSRRKQKRNSHGKAELLFVKHSIAVAICEGPNLWMRTFWLLVTYYCYDAELTFDRTELGRRESRRSWRACSTIKIVKCKIVFAWISLSLGLINNQQARKPRSYASPKFYRLTDGGEV